MPQKYSMSATGGPTCLVGMREADRVTEPAKPVGTYRQPSCGLDLVFFSASAADMLLQVKFFFITASTFAISH